MGNICHKNKPKKEDQDILKWTKSRYSSNSMASSIGTDISEVSEKDEEDNNMEDSKIVFVLKLLDDAMASTIGTDIAEVSKEDEEDNNMEDSTILFVLKLLDDLKII